MQRISLGNTVFEGRNNVYLLRGESTTLVDAGVATDDVRTQLRSALDDDGLTLADIDELVLTHWHEDHAGLAAEIQEQSDATVYVHEADAPLVANDPEAVADNDERLRTYLDEWRLPDDKRGELLTFLDSHGTLRGDDVDVTTVADGDVLSVADRDLEVIHLPGHAAGLCAFAFDGDEGEEAFVGDTVLPKYTPNVGGADVRVDSPLATYVDSLVRVIERDFERAWPGHRDPIDEPSERAATIIDHHRDRTRRVVDVLDEHGPCDVWTVSAHLFGELENIHILHGPGEAFAHIDHLEDHGVVEVSDREWELVDDDPDIDAMFPTLSVE